jgi:hypothetical protein
MKFACIVCETLLVECGPGAKTLFWIRELVLVPLSLSHFVPASLAFYLRRLDLPQKSGHFTLCREGIYILLGYTNAILKLRHLRSRTRELPSFPYLMVEILRILTPTDVRVLGRNWASSEEKDEDEFCKNISRICTFNDFFCMLVIKISSLFACWK